MLKQDSVVRHKPANNDDLMVIFFLQMACGRMGANAVP
jgi:hypothetical protein